MNRQGKRPRRAFSRSLTKSPLQISSFAACNCTRFSVSFSFLPSFVSSAIGASPPCFFLFFFLSFFFVLRRLTSRSGGKNFNPKVFSLECSCICRCTTQTYLHLNPPNSLGVQRFMVKTLFSILFVIMMSFFLNIVFFNYIFIVTFFQNLWLNV